jgi:adenine-specific DNA-methyltransferase
MVFMNSDPILTTSAVLAIEAVRGGSPFVIFNGDCALLLTEMAVGCVDLFVTSPPYFMGKSYDRSYRVEDFYKDVRAIAPDASRVVRPGGNMAWQVGYHVTDGHLLPLDFAIHDVFRADETINLRNRIIWQFGHGTHAKRRFSGRHEMVLWYGKGSDSYFDLDAVRVPQKYPGKRHYKGPRKGEYSGNPHGKNPSDVWDIPNVKAKHVEKTAHPCQFPIALAQRLVRSLSPVGGLIFDPFSGSGTSGIAACLESRQFLGADTSAEFCEIAIDRYSQLLAETLQYRPIDRPIQQPTGNDSVSRIPPHFAFRE